MRLLALATLVAGLTGCATSLTAAHDAKVLDRGHFEGHFGTGVIVPVGVISELGSEGLTAARDIVEKTAGGGRLEVSEQTAITAGTALVALVVSPPSPVSDLTLRYGVYDRLEVGLRKSGPTWKLEGWGQILEGDWNVVGGVGLSRASYDDGALGLLDRFSFASFGALGVDATVLAGKQWEFGSFYFGPKVAFASYSSEGRLVQGTQVVVTSPTGGTRAFELDLASSLVGGAVVGGRVGWKYVWLTAELGVYASRYRPTVVGVERDLGGPIIFPHVGVVGRY